MPDWECGFKYLCKMVLNKKIFACCLTIVFVTLTSFTIPERLEKKISKEIKSTFAVEAFQKTSVFIDTSLSLPAEINREHLFKLNADNKQLGYLYYGKAPSRTDEFNFMVLFDKDLIIKKIKVLVYREDYGGEIGSKRWLKQFEGVSSERELVYKQDIAAISGATISVKSMTHTINQLLKSIALLHQNKII